MADGSSAPDQRPTISTDERKFSIKGGLRYISHSEAGRVALVDGIGALIARVVPVWCPVVFGRHCPWCRTHPVSERGQYGRQQGDRARDVIPLARPPGLESYSCSMLPRDPLAEAERAGLAEEGLSFFRHAARNKLGSIRNATYYLRRRAASAPSWTEDPRIEQFFGLIDSELVALEALLSEGQALPEKRERQVRSVDVARCLEQAVSAARVDPAGLTIGLQAESGRVEADPEELAVAFRCLIEQSAMNPASAGKLRVRGTCADAGYAVEIDAQVPEGVWQNLARRLVARSGGRLECAQATRVFFVQRLQEPGTGPG